MTDIAQANVGPLVAAIQADGGTFVLINQSDGNVTLTAQLPLDAPDEERPAGGEPEYPWMPIARAELGIDRAANPLRVEQYLETTGFGAQSDGIPWCSAFVNFCVTRSGLQGTNSALARSWLNWGASGAALRPGCIVVLSRGTPPQGHVGFYVGTEGGHIRLLGGNQHGSVNVASFPFDRVIEKRIPAT